MFIDNFAGGGGASTGIEIAIGRSVDAAINHDPAAIAMHQANHPGTYHYCESVWDVDPRVVAKGRPVGHIWFSPDCKHFSKAKGGKPVEKGIRGLAWITLRWVATVKPRVIMLENVEEFKTWGPLIAKVDPETGRMLKIIRGNEDEDDKIVVSEPGEFVPIDQRYLIPDPKKKGRTFKSFVNALKRHGYDVEWRELRACDYGAPTIRKRFFLVARCDGQPIVWPEPTHGEPNNPEVMSGKLKPWRTAAEIIDWDIPCPSIFERKKPLAKNTLRRIARGIMKYVINNDDPYIANYYEPGFEEAPDPFIVKVNHAGNEFRGQGIKEPMQTMTAKNGYGLVTPFISKIGQTKFGGDNMQYPLMDPLTTIVTKAEHLLVSPTLIQVGYGEGPGQEPRALDLKRPLGTIVAGGNKFAVAAAYLIKHYGGNYTGAGNDLNDPLSTITTVDHNALVTAHVAQHFGESIGHGLDRPSSTITAINKSALVTSNLVKLRGKNIGQPVNEPLRTVTSGGLHHAEVRAFLIAYYGSSVGQDVKNPLGTITTRERFGLVMIKGTVYQIVDIGMRMLEPHELYAAQGFPISYIISGYQVNGKAVTKSDQVARCGNSVPPPFATALVRANMPEHCPGSGNVLTFERYKEPVGQLQLSI
ncbi:DNA cytosine methyltransferase [Paenibacillus periandrae]|uniref:DNA cytosine methyltransferase n=1 Tax=Paenibacillus periandrae TaxID=1761741 RepID=UPI001F09DC29